MGPGGGTFASPEEVYEQCLQIWRCSRCAGTHRQMYNGAAPLAAHQRLVFVEVQAPQLCYYAGVGGSTPEGEGMAAWHLKFTAMKRTGLLPIMSV